MSNIHVQFLDNSGWRNCATLSASNNAERILIEMRSAAQSYPGHRIRAVDEDGRVVDILN
jgi:hypothetical protein